VPTIATAGTKTSFTIQLHDQYNNRVVAGGEMGSLAAYTRLLPDGAEPGDAATITDNADGMVWHMLPAVHCNDCS
jgi:hypothetical protein